MESQPLSRLKQEAIFWLARRLPACTEFVQVMSQSLERQLTLHERLTLRLHFLYCEYCLRYMKHLRFMREAIRARSAKILDDEVPLPVPALPTEARERLKRALEDKSK